MATFCRSAPGKGNLRLRQPRAHFGLVSEHHASILLFIECRPFRKILAVRIAIRREIHPVGRDRIRDLAIEVRPWPSGKQVLENVSGFGAMRRAGGKSTAGERRPAMQAARA